MFDSNWREKITLFSSVKLIRPLSNALSYSDDRQIPFSEILKSEYEEKID